jgi:hypothetical protein
MGGDAMNDDKVTVDFRSAGPGKCRWCKAERDVVLDLAFGDGSFAGKYCFADFKKALLDKLEAEPAKAERRGAAAIPLNGQS